MAPVHDNSFLIMDLSRIGWGKWAVIAAISCIVVFYFIFDPMETRFMPQCLFHHFTGLKCVGCGTQRMAHALLHFDFIGAIRANAFVALALPIIFFLLWLEASRRKHPRLYARIYSSAFIWTVGALMIAWMIIRNIFDL